MAAISTTSINTRLQEAAVTSMRGVPAVTSILCCTEICSRGLIDRASIKILRQLVLFSRAELLVPATRRQSKWQLLRPCKLRPVWQFIKVSILEPRSANSSNSLRTPAHTYAHRRKNAFMLERDLAHPRSRPMLLRQVLRTMKRELLSTPTRCCTSSEFRALAEAQR